MIHFNPPGITLKIRSEGRAFELKEHMKETKHNFQSPTDFVLDATNLFCKIN